MRVNRRLRKKIEGAGYKLVPNWIYRRVLDLRDENASLSRTVHELKEKLEESEAERRIQILVADNLAERAIAAEIELVNLRPVSSEDTLLGAEQS